MGLTFKENCSDIRNSKVFDIIEMAKKKHLNVDVFDPLVHKSSIDSNLKINFIKYPKINSYDSILLAVSHDYFKKIGLKEILSFVKKDYVIFDIKNIFPNKNNFIKL